MSNTSRRVVHPFAPVKGCEVCPFTSVEDEYTIHNGRLWIANLRAQDQTLLGTTFITAKRHVPEVDYLTKSEWDELLLIQTGLCIAIRTAFKPKTFNIACLKNDAFKKDPDNTPPEAGHVHYHVKPRYGNDAVLVGDEWFLDPMPGRYLENFERHKPKQETAILIAQTIRDHMPVLA